MARISNKAKALAYAAEHGIILTVEDDMTMPTATGAAHLSATVAPCTRKTN